MSKLATVSATPSMSGATGVMIIDPSCGSTLVTSNGSPCIFGEAKVICTAITSGGYTFTGPITVSISGTGSPTSSGKKAVLVGDTSASTTVVGVAGNNSKDITFTVKIDSDTTSKVDIN